jgi:hypothetical protein
MKQGRSRRGGAFVLRGEWACTSFPSARSRGSSRPRRPMPRWRPSSARWRRARRGTSPSCARRWATRTRSTASRAGSTRRAGRSGSRPGDTGRTTSSGGGSSTTSRRSSSSIPIRGACGRWSGATSSRRCGRRRPRPSRSGISRGRTRRCWAWWVRGTRRSSSCARLRPAGTSSGWWPGTTIPTCCRSSPRRRPPWGSRSRR